MKNLFFTILLLMGLGNVAQAQQKGLRLGVHVGIPLSDASTE